MAYQYCEYPKHVYPDPEDPKKYVVVNSEEEEATAMAGSALVREGDERKRLMALAEIKSVDVDGRWSLARMKKALIDAGHDADANPFA